MFLEKLRSNVTLTVLSLYLLLDGAFMLVRVPPNGGFGVPTGEILIIIFFLSLPFDARYVRQFFSIAPVVPLVVWWSYAFSRVAMGFWENGMWALRDATSVIESLYLWIGFVVAAGPGGFYKILNLFRRLTNVAVLIILTYPFRASIHSVSPKIYAVVGKPAPLFFTYQMSYLLALLSALRNIIAGRRIFGFGTSALAGILIVFMAAFLQARTVYLQILAMIGVLALIAPRGAFRLLYIMGVGVVVLAVVLALGVQLPGRLGADFSFDFFLQHLSAIWGSTDVSDTGLRGASAGVGQRLGWWSAIWDNLTASGTNFFFGLGYGISLVGLAHDLSIASVVREPHNSLVSALGRAGIVGLTLYLWFHASMARIFYRTYRSYSIAKEDGFYRLWILLLIVLFIFCWIYASGEDAFEKPYVAIPYYFFSGVLLRMYYAKKVAVGEKANAPAGSATSVPQAAD